MDTLLEIGRFAGEMTCLVLGICGCCVAAVFVLRLVAWLVRVPVRAHMQLLLNTPAAIARWRRFVESERRLVQMAKNRESRMAGARDPIPAPTPEPGKDMGDC